MNSKHFSYLIITFLQGIICCIAIFLLALPLVDWENYFILIVLLFSIYLYVITMNKIKEYHR